MRHARGFTIIEVLVVIAMITVLVSILLPALGGARATSRQAVCSSNLRSVAQAVAVYVGQHGYFPISYAYGADDSTGLWRPEDQSETHADPRRGYVHWSFSLYDAPGGGGGLPERAFTCPGVLHGGAPRTNPGANPDDWEPGQVDGTGGNGPSPLPKDRQAARVAYTGNAAVFARNKFNSRLPRQNRFVSAADVDASRRGSAGVILAAEFFDNRDAWTSLATGAIGNIKSHRSLDPFKGITAGDRVFEEPAGDGPRFVYPARTDILPTDRLGQGEIVNGRSRLNAVGRHHGSGKGNFAFVDGHVDLTTVLETIRLRLWGDRFYSITGGNAVNLEANAW